VCQQPPERQPLAVDGPGQQLLGQARQARRSSSARSRG
jgi:hypothetical protein